MQFPGVTWNARDSSVKMEAVDTSFYVQPRVGFAWDIRGTGETVLRGGAGMYLFHDAQQPYDSLIDVGAGVRSYSRCCGGFTLKDLEGLGSSNLVFNAAAIDINDDKQPKSYNWSLTVNKKLPWSMNLELGYVGNKSVDQMNFDVANLFAGSIHSLKFQIRGWPGTAYQSDLEIDLSAFAAGCGAELN